MNPHVEDSESVASVTVHCIGNAHIDPVWLWRWGEGFEVVRSTCRSALDRMKETPEFVFSFSSAGLYQWLEEGDPELFEEIRQRVAEGRWDLVGGWWIQPDCNIPGGESYVRQGLYGQRYFRSRFGKMATVGYNVDTFGHHGMLPQILSKSGLSSYVFFRPDPQEKELPNGVFWWESPDGSRVLACRPPHHYGTDGAPLEGRLREAAAQAPPPLREVLSFYGVGNHGGGPTKQNIASIQRVQADPQGPQARFARVEDFFSQARAATEDYPIVAGDLQHHARGCYTAHSEVKRLNRRAENLLLTAEKWASVASISGGPPYPQESLTRAWQNILFNQFHDIIAGTSIRAAYEDARDMYGESLHRAREALNLACQTIAGKIDTRGEGPAVVVFNPSPWPRYSPVEVDLSWNRDLYVTDDRGQPVPGQRIQPAATVASGRARVVFLADLPPLGYRVYRFLPGSVPENVALTENERTLEICPYRIENDFWRLEIDPDGGYLSRLFDQRNGVEALAGPGCVPLVINDPSDTWSHGVPAFRDEIGSFGQATGKVVEEGPVRATLRMTSRWGNSHISQDFTLYRHHPAIDVRLTVDWREQFRTLKLSIPVNVSQPEATYSVPYGFLQRLPNGEEEPGQAWIDVSGITHKVNEEETLYGLALLNDSKYGYDVLDNDLRMTVLRSPIYAWHDPAQPDPDGIYDYLDQGRQEVHYALVPHVGSWTQANLARAAEELNNPLFALVEASHEGSLPRAQGYLHSDPASVVVSVVKKAEDSADLIVRAQETMGRETSARLSLPLLGRQWRADFGPCEIKTFRVPTGMENRGEPVQETNLLELDETPHGVLLNGS